MELEKLDHPYIESLKTILLIEDEHLIALIEKKILEKYGFRVVNASSGEKGVDIINSGINIDLVLMDINLGSGIDGTEAAEIILASHDIPLIFLSSHVERDVVEKTEKITSYGYIVKNSGETVLIASIKMAFRLFKSQQKEKESDAFRKRVFESSIVPIVIMDSHTYKYIDCNPAAAAIYGFSSREDTIGKTPEDVSAPFQYNGKASSYMSDYYIKRAIEDGQAVFEWLHIRKDGKMWDAEVHLMPFESEGRLLLQFTLQDITERKAAESIIEKWKNRYEMIVAASGMVVYDYDVSSGSILWGESLSDVLGYSGDELDGGIDQWISWLHPEDKDAALAYLNDAMEKCSYWDAEYRLLNKNGDYVWVRDRGFFIPDSNGKAERQLGLIEDITERKKSDEKLKSLLCQID